MIICRPEPLSYYVERIDSATPFTSLLYGDGEWLVVMRQRTGASMAHGEIVTPAMENELVESLHPDDPTIIRATDLNLIEWEQYTGNDHALMHDYGRKICSFLSSYERDWELFDGVVWENAVRNGELAPFLRAIKRRQGEGTPLVLVGNQRLSTLTFLSPRLFVPIPDTNAYGVIDELEERLLNYSCPGIYFVCAGLTTIPLIMRLREAIPDATFLDLGSTFDLFVRLPTRGWRVELYRNPRKYRDVVRRNLEGV